MFRKRAHIGEDGDAVAGRVGWLARTAGQISTGGKYFLGHQAAHSAGYAGDTDAHGLAIGRWKAGENTPKNMTA